MSTPQNNPPRTPLHDRLLDKLVESPFATLWNLTVVVGGLMALIYFTQLGYLPDMDLKSSAAFFLSIAVLSMFLVGLLVLVFSVPSWMLRTEVQPITTSPQSAWTRPVRVALSGFFVASAYLLMIGLFGLDPGHEQLARTITWTSIVVMLISGFPLAVFLRNPMAHTFTLLIAWLMVTPTFWLLALMRVRAPEGDGVSIVLAGAFISALIVANAVMSALRYDTRKQWLAFAILSLSLPVIYLTLPSDQPSIPENVFKKLSLGGIANTIIVIKKPACEGINVFLQNACVMRPGTDIGCITPTRMANRLGEYLLVFESGQQKIKVPLQKNDVIVWSISAEKPTCGT